MADFVAAEAQGLFIQLDDLLWRPRIFDDEKGVVSVERDGSRVERVGGETSVQAADGGTRSISPAA